MIPKPFTFSHVPKIESRAALLSLGTSVVLLAIKYWAYVVTGSSAIFSDALESIVNVIASGVAFYALTLAHQPADAEHPYGHGKVEFLSAAVEGGMILVAAFVVIAKAVDTLVFHDLVIQELKLGTLLIAAAMLINGVVGSLLVRVGRKNDSMVLEADGKHLLTDAITSGGALAAIVLVQLTGWTWIDPAAGIILGTYIGLTGIMLVRRSTAGLMDEQDIADEKTLTAILDAHLAPNGKPPLICSYHKLRHRHSGRYHWVDFHIMLPPETDIRTGHAVASAIEYEIELKLGEGNATAHIEPCENPDCPAHHAVADAVHPAAFSPPVERG